MAWTIVYHTAAQAEADAQPRDIRARLLRFTQLIAEHGLSGLPPKAAKHLQDDVWELRLTGRDGIARAFYVTRSGQRLAILRVFGKKTQKTPARELGLAMKRAKEIT